jgi:hypothetical protein
MSFDPSNYFLKIWDSNSQNESSLESVWADSLTLSYTPGSANVTFELHFQPIPFHVLTLTKSPKLRL